MTRKSCTDNRPCNLATCYACRRALIDATATRMLEQGMPQESVDQYRYPAINALAFEIPAIEKPAPKARKASKPPVLKHSQAYYRQIAKGLRNANSRAEAAHVLADHTVADLNHIWALAGRTDRIPAKLRKDERLSHMIENLVGYRLDSEAIRTGAQS